MDLTIILLVTLAAISAGGLAYALLFPQIEVEKKPRAASNGSSQPKPIIPRSRLRATAFKI